MEAQQLRQLAMAGTSTARNTKSNRCSMNELPSQDQDSAIMINIDGHHEDKKSQDG
jgi:hypothetical protein